MNLETLSPAWDSELASLIRRTLKANHLDIPGTVYYDDSLDHLSEYYDHPSRIYHVLLEDEKLLGGIGLAEFPGFPNCCELQKLYLSEKSRGKGFGHFMVRHIEQVALEMGYKRMYLETHTNLQTAIRLYEKHGYQEIPKPAEVVHGTMNRFYLKDLSQTDQ